MTHEGGGGGAHNVSHEGGQLGGYNFGAMLSSITRSQRF